MASNKITILVADDDQQVVDALAFHLKRWGYQVATALDKPALIGELERGAASLVLLDLRFGKYDGVEVLGEIQQAFPQIVTVMLTAHGSIDTAVTAIKHGAYDYLTKPPDFERLQVVLKNAAERQSLNRRIANLQQMVDSRDEHHGILGNSEPICQVRELISSVAGTDATVMILGESGTGKELVARSVHEQSERCKGPFIPVNMAALPRELVESTLFGHHKGAFTGAHRDQQGCCEAAHGGTLFLDEIGEMDISLQSKLLRFLQERTLQRVGSSETITVDTRIVSATNREPEEMVRAGTLREDLYYRLNVVPLSLPPLRDRKDDIGLLAMHLLRKAAHRHRKEVESLSPEAIELLAAFDWPGNVRQLENIMERLVVFARASEITADAIPAEIRAGKSSCDSPQPAATATLAAVKSDEDQPIAQTLDDIERQAIIDALDKTGGKVAKAAEMLGLGLATAYRKIKRYEIELPK